jgi:ubiquitin-activating enzyme E1
MNPHLAGKITAFLDRVGQETESTFNDDFWERLSGVTNALDNVDARKYVDRRCVYFCKPLLESGTLGTKGNTQVVLPFLTESYSSSSDPPEKSIPICTLKNFPNAIEHTIQWARDMFEGLFKGAVENVNLYLGQPNFVDSLKQGGGAKDTLETVRTYLVDAKPVSFEECVVWARLKFEDLFNSQIQQLLYNFPADSVTSSGQPFWSGPKRAPTPLVFDAADPMHMGFIVHAANLHAFNYGLKGDLSPEVYAKVLPTVIVPEFAPKSGVKIHVNESEAAAAANAGPATDEEELMTVLASLPPPSTFAGMRLLPVEFEKDDDSNGHIDFITSCSNLRARNYNIKEADRHKTKFIAGRIIPAIATTTSLVTGLVCLELYKIVGGKEKVEAYKNGFLNLSTPFLGFSEPIACAKFKYHEKEWSLWDRFEVEEDITLKEFLAWFKEKHELDVTMLSCNGSLLYSFFMQAKKLQERLPLPMSKVVELVCKKELTCTTLVLEMCVNDRDGEDVEVPYVKLRIRR